MDARKKLEQLRRSNSKNKSKNKSNNKASSSGKTNNVQDLRQIISKKTKKKVPKSKDLRETNKKLEARKRPASTATRPERPMTRLNKKTISNNPAGPFFSEQYKQHGLYVPPWMRNSLPFNMPDTNLDARRSNPTVSATAAPRQSNASILISNLHPKITQSEIIELCSDIGPMSGLNFINQSTVIATFQNSGDAVKAVKIYNNRLLDGRPMLVNMMPNLS